MIIGRSGGYIKLGSQEGFQEEVAFEAFGLASLAVQAEVAHLL